MFKTDINSKNLCQMHWPQKKKKKKKKKHKTPNKEKRKKENKKKGMAISISHVATEQKFRLKRHP